MGISDKTKEYNRRQYLRRKALRLHETSDEVSRVCKKCDTEKPIGAFRIVPLARAGRSGTCNECLAAAILPKTRQRRHERWERELVYIARHRAKDKGLECTITESDILAQLQKQGGMCYWFGVPLGPHETAYHPLAPSLDRLDPSEGYTPGNVVVATRFANTGRGNFDAKETKQMIANIARALNQQGEWVDR